MHRDSKMLTLLALRATKALLIACKEVLDLPQGRILDAAVEKYAIDILGVRKVRQIQRAMRDPVKAALLIREPRTDDEAPPKVESAKAPPTSPPRPKRKTHVTKAQSKANASPHVSFLREEPDADE